MARRKRGGWRLRLAALVLLTAMAGAIALWWHMRSWTPPRQTYPRR
jgi:hypothetical protein